MRVRSLNNSCGYIYLGDSNLGGDEALLASFNAKTSALNPHVEDVAIFDPLRTAGVSTELNHGPTAIAEGEAWQLTPAPIAVEETDVPALAEGGRHQDFVHGVRFFSLKVGLEGDILPS
jgi:hypothetical protein